MPIIKKVCDKCNYEISNLVFQRHYDFCNGEGPRRKRPPKNGTCKHCGKNGFGPFQLGAHMTNCELYPGREEKNKKISKASSLKRHSNETKQKLSDLIKEKVRNGSWHFSFSRSRTHDYNGIKLHGMWEVKYAEFLDANKIEWRRPDEKFKYNFEGKVSYYTPDFYLIKEEVYIEIKGYKTRKDEAKWAQFPLKLKVLQGEDLVQLGILNKKVVKIFRGSSAEEQVTVNGSIDQE